MRSSIIKTTTLVLLVMVIVACKQSAVETYYDPDEFTLMVAASNDGEVGPCG